MVGNNCAVATCKNTSAKAKTSKQNLLFFRFPKDPQIRKQWIKRCNRKDKLNPENSRICSQHFTSQHYDDHLKAQIMNTIPKKLNSSAVPSLYLSSASDPPSVPTTPRQQRALVKERKELVRTLLGSEAPKEQEVLELVPSTSQDSDSDILKRQYDAIKKENESLRKRLEEAQTEIAELKQKGLEQQSRCESENLVDVEIAFKAMNEIFSDFLTPNQIEFVLKKKQLD